MEKQTIISLLEKWIKQRPGLDWRNYGDAASYRAEIRKIAQQKSDAEILLSAVERSNITAEELTAAFRAFSGRLTLKDGKLEYCTGQYFPTEYRAATCAVLAAALWDYHREDYQNDERPGDSLRKAFRHMFGRGIASRWFN